MEENPLLFIDIQPRPIWRQLMCHPTHTNDSIKTEVSVYPTKTKLQGYTRQPLSD